MWLMCATCRLGFSLQLNQVANDRTLIEPNSNKYPCETHKPHAQYVHVHVWIRRHERTDLLPVNTVSRSQVHDQHERWLTIRT